MTDLDDVPAVPPSDTGGDERAGMIAAGVVLVVLGWGLAIVVNVGLHLIAPVSGTVLGPVVVHTTLGPYAWATMLIGLGTGAVGLGMALIAWGDPKGPLVLPGQPY